MLVETGAGAESRFRDQDYVSAGARVVGAEELYEQANVVVKIRPPGFNRALHRHEVQLMQEGARLVSLLYPAQNKDLVDMLRKREVNYIH